MFFRKKKGFTLIELLVVIAIIGILATIVLVSLNTARTKARDARRQSDMHQMSLAFEMYYDSQSTPSYKNLPDIATIIPAAQSIGTCPGTSCFMNPVPLDPVNAGNYQYKWTDNGAPTTIYCVWARLEVPAAATYVLANNNGVKTITPTEPAEGTCGGL